MNAKEAKELSYEKNVIEDSIQMGVIIYKIKEACKKGEYFIWFYQFIKEDVRSRLVDMGYKVHNTQFERNGTMTKIEWS
jgi:tRNA G26 N,N-dimethylase Trm1